MSIDCCKSYVGKQIIGLLPSESVEPPVANFSGSPTSINIGETVAFTDLSTNTPTSWSWAFAGGTPATSTTQNPSVVYNTAGTYNVDLTASNAGGSDLESKPNYITVINPYLLDNYSGAGAAYSVRKLSSSYTGAALRVRRSSDNTEQDIGFVGLDLDTTALSSFVGAGAGWVTKWYDQSGNNNHGIQTVGSRQPLLVSSGVINIINGRPCIPFGGANDTSLNLTTNIIHPSSWSNFASMGRSSLGLRISSIAAKTTTAPFASVIFNDNNLYVQSTTYYGSTSYNLTGLKLISTFFINTNQLYSYVNSINQNIVGISTPTSGLFEQIGKQYTNAQNGFINEIIFYPSDKSANRAAIDSNIMTYFSIV